jgi:hypothetical protein
VVNLYAYTYPSTMHKFPGYVLTKVGDSHRDVDVRISEQGGAAENEPKIRVGAWPNCRKIRRDHDVHEVLKNLGLYHYGAHKGTEWFKIPGNTVEEAFAYLDAEITALEGSKVRAKVVLRQVQQRALEQAMQYIEAAEDSACVIANLCPRFGKTIWALSLFNSITAKYGNRVMLLPAYWLSVHSSFINELDRFSDFNDIVQIDPEHSSAAADAAAALCHGQRIVVPMSLHGNLPEWQIKHQWIADIDTDDIFMFADEGDFGTHTQNQRDKLAFLFGHR